MRGFLIRCGVTGVAVLVASQVISGIEIDSLAAGVVAAMVLALLNAMVRPVLYLLSAPFILVTLGLFLLQVVSVFVEGFHVEGFWPTVGGAILISLVSGLLNLLISERGSMEMVVSSNRPRRIRNIN